MPQLFSFLYFIQLLTYIIPTFRHVFYKLSSLFTHIRPPFGVPSRSGNPNTYRPNTTQPQPNFNLQDMDPNMFAYAQILGMGGSQPFFQIPQTFPTMGGSQPSTQETDPEIEMVSETRPEPVVEEF
ncbi:hypothetical protein Hanom_Chr06g00503601 [Helianthus anomalus]